MIWDYENIYARRLFLWAIVSALAGAYLSIFGESLWQPFGLQTLVWGIAEIVLAWRILHQTKKHLGRASTWEEEVNEADRFRRLLWITAGLNVIVLGGSAAAVYFWQTDSLFWRGVGIGVTVQSVFLIIFVLQHTFKVPEPLQLPHLPLFTHPDHEPFLFNGGKPAAVLVHGFPGTALEMRSIGHALNDAEWIVRGMRLPGFGPELADVIAHSNADWVAAVRTELDGLRQAGHTPLLLVGFSFGGGLALQVAAQEPLAGLVLIAPLTWREPPWGKVLLDFVRALLPLSIYPFRHIRPEHPMVEEEFLQYLPEISLDNPDHARELQYLQMPLCILDQIRAVGREALAAAPLVRTPTLLIQGTQDKVIHPHSTKYLRNHLSSPVTYKAVNGPHSLTMPHNPAFDTVLDQVCKFAASRLSRDGSEQPPPLDGQ